MPAAGSYKVVDKSNPYDGVHEVLAVDANDGNSYIIDLSGAQVGLKTPIVPLDNYIKMFGTRIVDIYRHDRVLCELHLQLMRGFGSPSAMQRKATQYYMYGELNRVVESCEQSMRTTLEELMQEDQNYYAAGKEYLEQQIRSALRKAFAEREKEGHPPLSLATEYLDLSLGEGVEPLELNLRDDGVGSGIYRQWVKQEKAWGLIDEELDKRSSKASAGPWKFDFIARPVFTLARPTLCKEERIPRSWLSLLLSILQR